MRTSAFFCDAAARARAKTLGEDVVWDVVDVDAGDDMDDDDGEDVEEEEEEEDEVEEGLDEEGAQIRKGGRGDVSVTAN